MGAILLGWVTYQIMTFGQPILKKQRKALNG